MTKFFKKSVACMIAVLMIVSSLPFTAITANAATTSTVTIGTKSYGLFTNGANTRWKGSYANVVNDSAENAFDMGFINFDISTIDDEYQDLSGTYTVTVQKATDCTKFVPLRIMYPTKNQSSFNVTTNVSSSAGNASKIDDTAYSTIWTNGSSNGYFKTAKSYFELQDLTTVTLSDYTSKTVSVDISSAIKAAKSAGLSYATVVFLLGNTDGSDGGSGSGSSWSDTNVYIGATTVNVTVTEAEQTTYKTKPSTTFTAKKGTATVNWNDSSDKTCAGYYNNLLFFASYSEGLSGSPTADTGANYCYTRAWYPTMVFLYDGVNDSFAPVMGSADKSDFSTRYLNYFVPMDSNDTSNLADSSNFYCDTWVGGKGGTLDYTWNWTQSHHNVRASISDTSSGYFGLTRNTFYPHSSKLHVKSSITFEGNSGYSHMQNIYWFAGSHTNGGQAAASGDKNFGQANKTTYVINYKPLYTAANEAANALKTFEQNKYTIKSVNAYYSAIQDLYDFNPNSYFTSASESTIPSNVNSCAQQIKNLVEAYNTAKKGLTERPVFYFQRADGTQIAQIYEENEATAYAWGITNGNVTTTATTAKTTVGDGKQHSWKTYSWPTTATDNVFKEIETVNYEDCSGGTATCTKKAVCSTCNAEYGDLLEHKYTYTTIDTTNHTKKCTVGGEEVTEAHTKGTDGKCTLCGQSLLDYTAYNAANTEAGNIKAQHAVAGFKLYTTESYTEYDKIVTEVSEKKDTVTTQAELDELTNIMLSAKTILRKNSCTVKVYVIPEDGTGATNAAKTYTSTYGSQLELDLAAIDSTAGGVKAWIVKTDDGVTQTKILTADTKITLYVTKDATVDVYTVANPNTEADKYSKVTFLGKNGSVVAVKYVKEDETLNTEDVDIPSVPFYTSTSWDKASVTGTGSDIYVRAQYTYSTEATKCNVNLVKDGAITWTKEYSYDSYVYLDEADKTKQYALASDKEGTKILTYLDGIEFYAPKTAEIYVVEVTSKEAKIAITGNFKEELTESEVEKVAASFNCKFYLPEDCEVIEWGAEISSGTAKKVVKGEKISQGNEYTIRMKVKKTLVTGGTVTSFTGKAYLIYKDSTGTTHTIYSDEVTQSLV